MTKLGDYLTVKHGLAFKGEYFTDEVTPDVLVTPGNFAIGGGFKDVKKKYYAGPVPEEFVLRAGDLVVTMTDLSRAGDTLGYPALVPDSTHHRYLHNQRVGLVEIHRDADLDKRFLFYVLRSDAYRHHVLATASGSTVRHTSPSRICEFETVIPSLEVQRVVAKVLSALDDKIEQNRQTMRKLEQLAQGIYRAWFVDFDPVKAKAAGATSFPSMPQAAFDSLSATFEESEFGPIPERWVVKPLSDIAQLTMGQSPKSEFYNQDGVGLPFHQGVTDFGFRSPTHRVHCTAEGRIAKPRDVLVSVRAPVGRVNVANEELVLGRGLAGLRHHTNCQSYLHYQLRHIFADEDSVGEGTIYKAVTGRFLSAMPTLNPPTLMQREFESVIRPADDLIVVSENECRQLATTRDYLLPKLLSGEVRVDPDDVRAEASM